MLLNRIFFCGWNTSFLLRFATDYHFHIYSKGHGHTQFDDDLSLIAGSANLSRNVTLNLTKTCQYIKTTITRFQTTTSYPSEHLHLFRVSNRNNRTLCKVCSMSTIKTLNVSFDVSIINFEQNSRFVLVFPLLSLNK